jgi:hypothetical protein
MKKVSPATAPTTLVARVTDMAALRAAFGPGDSGHAVLQSLLAFAAPADLIRLAPTAAHHIDTVAPNRAVTILVEDHFVQAKTIH